MTPAAMIIAQRERRVRSALATRLRNGRVPDAPGWDEEFVAEVMAAFAPVLILVRLLDDGRVVVTNEDFGDGGLSLPAQDWSDFVAGVKAGDFDEMVTVPASATVAKATAEPETPAGPPAGDGKEAAAGPAASPSARPASKRPARAGKLA